MRGWVKKKSHIKVKGDITNFEEILKIKKDNVDLKK